MKSTLQRSPAPTRPTWARKRGRVVVRQARFSPEQLALHDRLFRSPGPMIDWRSITNFAVPQGWSGGANAWAGGIPWTLGEILTATEMRLRTMLERVTGIGNEFLTLNQAARKLNVSRTMLNTFVGALEAEGIVMRVPSLDPWRVDGTRLIAWLASKSAMHRTQPSTAQEEPSCDRARSAGCPEAEVTDDSVERVAGPSGALDAE